MLHFSRNQKIILASLLSAVVLVFFFVTWAGSKAADYVRKSAKEQTFLKGSLTVGDIGASLSGDVWINDIVWNDPQGKNVVKIPRVNITVRLRDVLSSGLSAASVSSIILEAPELHLDYNEKDGLNISRLVEMEPKDKAKEPKDAKPSFRGTIEIAKGLLQLTSGKNKLSYDNLDCKLSYAEFPKVLGTFQAKQNKATFAGKIELLYKDKEADIRVDLDGRTILLKDFFDMMPIQSNFTVDSGSIDNLKTVVEIGSDKKLNISAQGNFTDLKAQAKEQGIIMSGFKGSFSLQKGIVSFTNITGKLNDQSVTINGNVDINNEPFKLDLKIASNAFKISALSPSLGITDGIDFNAQITGSAMEPIAKGSFNAPSIKTDQLDATNVKGNFAYDKGVVRLTDASANVYGGTVNLTGSVTLADKSFNFFVNGSGLSSSSLSSSKIKGPLSFSANAKGTSADNSLLVSGNFAIGSGDFNGIPFNSMTGNFTKNANAMNFSNLVINTLAGSITTTATLDSNGKVSIQAIDASNISKENIKQNITNQINQEKQKITNALKKIF